MEILPFTNEHLPAAAEMFIRNFQQQRRQTPALPERMEDPGLVEKMLAGLMKRCTGIAAVQDGRLVGYMGWFLIDGFRDTERKAAYCPEWGHAAAAEGKAQIYRALYRAAAAQWAEADCQVHALTLLAHDRTAEKTWFWNGFGLAVVDAVRPMLPIGSPCPKDFTLRKATLDDVEAVTAIEAEHWQHYQQPPVLMAAHAPSGAEEIAALIANPKNGVWLALCGEQIAGYMRFEGSSFGAAGVVNSETTTANTGAFVRPAYRGQGLSPALLDAALQDFGSQGFERCSVDFESFNPEAASFWPKYFEPVCYSVMRVPER